MIFHIGSTKKLAIIPFNKVNPSFNTEEVNENDKDIRLHISLPCILYAGSDQGCGCGFRYALLGDGTWWNVEDDDEETKKEVQINHVRLYDYIRSNAPQSSIVEIYGCWDGNLNETCLSKEEIVLDTLLDKEFYFKEQGLYLIHT